MSRTLRTGLFRFAITCLALGGAAQAGVLPEDRADLLYFRYDGGGVTISGPSVLVRKSIGENVSVQGNYYIDMVSSASIDVVVSGASPDRGGRYEDERTQGSLSMDFLHGKSTYSIGYVNSDESDYKAKTRFYRAIWRNHRLHHYKNEHYWFGVSTSGTSDWVLGTRPDPATVAASPTAKNLHGL